MYYKDFDYTVFREVMVRNKSGKRKGQYADIIFTADTETSKEKKNTLSFDDNGNRVYDKVENYVVAWSISYIIPGQESANSVIWGRKPSEFIEALNLITPYFSGADTLFFFHNLGYDWVFLQKFMIEAFGEPVNQLNTKPFYPIAITFENGIVFRDSLIIAQRTLEKWGNDLNVKHKKAVGKWDYDKIRTQAEDYTQDEILYISNDVLALAECIEKLRKTLGNSVYSLPFTATGITRREVRQVGSGAGAHRQFKRIANKDYELQLRLEAVYHGGYTHANRRYIDRLITDKVVAYDFASSYPYCMMSEMFPMEQFTPMTEAMSKDEILKQSSKFAFLFKFIGVNLKLKPKAPMPPLQLSKLIASVNPVIDNGRVLQIDYAEIYLTEEDLYLIDKYYEIEKHACTEVYYARKDYLPKWFRDYIYDCFRDKTMLKGGDSVAYMMAKARINSLYGMSVTKPVKSDIVQDYSTGEYSEVTTTDEMKEKFEKYYEKWNTILPYCWGVWVTAYAQKNLFELGECAGTWIYSDTDSCYGLDWDTEAIDKYNAEAIRKLEVQGYQGIEHNNRMYHLGIAELDGVYSQFKTQGAKRYATRDFETDKLKITVAGVPKKSGVKCLNDDINLFKPGFIFDGLKTGKKSHLYNLKEAIEIKNGIEYGDSVDLTPADYTLDRVDFSFLEKELQDLYITEIEGQEIFYEEEY